MSLSTPACLCQTIRRGQNIYSRRVDVCSDLRLAEAPLSSPFFLRALARQAGTGVFDTLLICKRGGIRTRELFIELIKMEPAGSVLPDISFPLSSWVLAYVLEMAYS